jgi:predicted metal-dependent phosphoesterase TrpH
LDSLPRSLAAGASFGIEVLPGIELTAEHHGLEIHILGYFLDHTYAPLVQRLNFLRQARIERVHNIVEKLNAMNMPIKAEEVFALAQNGIPGRLHIARTMVHHGYIKNIYDAFKQYIGDTCPAYVGGFRLTPHDAIAVIRAAGGIPVLAHPYLLKNDELIPEFIKSGLMGLEVFYLEHSQGVVNFYLAMARKYNLLTTGGSDFHGQAKPDVTLGMLKLPYEHVEKLKEAKRNLGA